MQQLTSVWAGLDMRKRMVAGLAALAMFIAVIGLSRMATNTSMSLLYSGLESGAAGDVVKALEGRGVVYEIRGGAIFVDSSKRDSLRMTLASEGLPANSGKGYELLDGLSGFGTTSQMFDAAYWRAKEGELARTIVASPLIQNARVHIGNVSSQRFRQRNTPTASVTVTTANGALPTAQARALKFLIASAVPGLVPEQVSVIDSRGGLVASGDEAGDLPSVAADRAEQMKLNIERLLEARVGFGNAVVELNLETATEQESIRERRFDPESRVAVSTDTQETNNTASDQSSGGVTVASNLPEGDGAAGGGASNSNASETRERVNYEVSETTREVVRAPGATKRVTVAVLVDGIRSVSDTGEETWQPRSDEEIAALTELVAGAIGFDEARGDVITIKTLEFEPVETSGSAPGSSLFGNLGLDVMALIQMAILAVVTLVLGLFVLRPIFASASPTASLDQSQADGVPVLASAEGIAGPAGAAPSEGFPSADSVPDLPALSGEVADGDFLPPQMAVVGDISFDDEDPAGDAEDPVQRLRDLIAERQAETVDILRGWMEDEEEAV
ncbi:flagellar basal-body MS-ring/collar protein FliF [Aliiroseovarius marinus]|uniref:flagellar basal-body MS-ring/collar protein FliF n=1 Tax=Aliiroseovarius marinus TaxID=2500159 RepID=UPI003D7C54EC